MNEPPDGAQGRHPRPAALTIRGQLIWASIFPLASFGLLTMLLIAAALNNMAQGLILQKNTSQAQVAAAGATQMLSTYVLPLQDLAGNLGQDDPSAVFSRHASALEAFSAGVILTDLKGKVLASTPALPGLAGIDLTRAAGQAERDQPFSLTITESSDGQRLAIMTVPVKKAGEMRAMLFGFFTPAQTDWFPSITAQALNNGRLYLIDSAGSLLARAGQNSLNDPPILAGPIQALIAARQPKSALVELEPDAEQMVVSYAPVGGSGLGVVLEEPWQTIIAPAMFYEWSLGVLLAIGILLSMVMLSVSIGRLIRPLEDLSLQADTLGPGSIFRPLKENGPVELRALFRAFNLMVIRLAEQQTTLHQYAEKALLSQEEERQRISHELHDETVQDLVGLVQRVDLCRDEMETDPEQARRRLDELSSLAEQALEDLRRISNALRPPVLQDLGLATAVQSLCNDFSQQMPKIRCNYVAHQELGRLPPELELAVFRVVQEALSNVRRHSQGTTQVDVGLEIRAPITIASIHDNGTDFQVQDVQTLVREGHLGMAGMYERARLFNGEISITSTPDEGTTITLRIPMQPEMITDPQTMD